MPMYWVPLLLMVVLVVLNSCIYTERVTNDFVKMLDKPRRNMDDKIKMNGAYQYIQKESYNHPTGYKEGRPIRYIDTPYLDHPIFFFDNGLLLYYNALSLDSNDFKPWQEKYSTEKWGLNQ